MQPVTIEDTDVKEVPEVLVKVESIANQHPVWNLNQPNMKNLNFSITTWINLDPICDFTWKPI